MTNTARLAVLPVALACLTVSSPGHADDATGIADAVDRIFRPLMEVHDVPGMAAGLTVDGRRYLFSYGVASRETRAPVTRDTLFEIGSISKTYAATLVTYAAATNRLSLDDNPGKFVPELRGSPIDKATIRDLGTYSAGGLPLQFPSSVKDEKGMLRYFKSWKPDAAPGTQRRYSNPSLGLFGHVAAKAMGGVFADLIESTILPKLGLQQTHIRVPESAMPDYAWGYAKANTPIRVGPGPFDAEAYGIKTTASDLLGFVEANIDPSGFETALRQAITGTHIGYGRVGGMIQGLGWEQYSWPVALDILLAGNGPAVVRQPNPMEKLDPPQVPSGPTLFNKTGSTNGFGAYAAFVPEGRIGVVMLANRAIPNEARIKAVHAALLELDASAQ